MPFDYCVKRPVSAVVTLKNGDVLIGGNYCANPQTKCPREAGEGYEKCFTICGQLGHAEAIAVRLIHHHGARTSEVRAIDVYNHSRPCDACRRLLDSYGILSVTRFHEHATPGPIDKLTIKNVESEFCLDAPGKHSSQQGNW